MESIKINKDILQDAINIANNVYAPLVGFLREKDFQSVLDNMRLTNGAIWSMPIVLDINQEDYDRLKNEKQIVITDNEEQTKVILNNRFSDGIFGKFMIFHIYNTISDIF